MNYYHRLIKEGEFEDSVADMEIEKAYGSPDFLDESEDDFPGPIHPADDSIFAWASDVYHPHNRDQQTSSSSMRVDQQRSVQSQPWLSKLSHHQHPLNRIIQIPASHKAEGIH